MTEKMKPWIEWNGGKCPVRIGTTVSVRYRNGAEEVRRISYGYGWKHMPDYRPEQDIVAYRVVKP